MNNWEENIKFITHPDSDGIMGSCGNPCYRCKEDKKLINFIKQNFIPTSEILEMIEGVKTDERKVAYFGEWQAETYEEKMLVNSVLDSLKQSIQDKYGK